MVKLVKNFLLWVHGVNQRGWFIVSCIHTLSGLWYSLVLAFFGESLKLVKVNGTHRTLSLSGIIFTILCVGWTLLYAASQRYYEYYSNNSKVYEPSGGEKLLGIVNRSFIEVCNSKKLMILKSIKSQKINSEGLAYEPCRQLELLSKELCRCLCFLLSQKNHNIRENDMSVRIFYNFPLERNDVWKMADNNSSDSSIPIEKLLKDDTTFYYILNNNKNSVFFNSKEEARKKGHYIPVSNDCYDSANNLQGSIACYKIIETVEGEPILRIIICISTYSKQFIKTDNVKDIEIASNNIKHFVIDEFSRRISIELASVYQQLLSNKDKKQLICQ